MSDPSPSAAGFVKSKFDNLSLIVLIIFLVCLLVWVDKHGNGDFEKWLEVFTAGFGGAYLSLITGSRQAWPGQQRNGPPAAPPPTGEPGWRNVADPAPAPSLQTSATDAAPPAPRPAGWTPGKPG